MIRAIFTVFLLILLLLTACGERKHVTSTFSLRETNFTGTIVVEWVGKIERYRISIFDSITGKTDKIYTPYEIFQVNIADANNDGKTDICIGIIKPTPFDPVLKKRLFIFQIDRDYIRPLWLSSRLVNPLEEFSTLSRNNTCFIQTIERQNKEQYCIHEYTWGSFGMVYSKQIAGALTYTEAKKILTN